MDKKWKGAKKIAYFQAYTNTYAKPEVLRAKYDEAIRQDGVVSLSIATRPDCLDEEVMVVLREFRGKIHTFVELGLQSSKDDTGRRINRGYDYQIFLNAVKKLRSIDIDVVVHVIFGLPGETYVRLVCESIAWLPRSMVIHRLTGDAPRELLIGPMWSLKKWEVLNAIDAYFKDHKLYQGKFYDNERVVDENKGEETCILI